MNRLCITASIALLPASLLAQNFTVSPDPSCSTLEGQRYTSLFGSGLQGRHQIADGLMVGPARLIKGIAFRADHRDYTDMIGMGRTWASLSIKMSSCDVTKVTTFYANNSTGTPQLVFSGPVTWPTLTGGPQTVPAPWSLDFPFATNYQHSGKEGLLADFQYSGGTLANKQPFSFAPYYLDSPVFGIAASSSISHLGTYRFAGGCVDSGSVSTLGAVTDGKFSAYSATHPTISQRNKYRISIVGSWFGYNTSAIMALGFKPDIVGFAVPGTSCNKVHLDTTGMVLVPVTTNAGGSFGSNLGAPGGLVPYSSTLAGLDVVMQTAWTDTKDGSFKLSAAGWANLPHLPIGDSTMKAMAKSIYGFIPTSIAGLVRFEIPVLRYAH